MDGQFDKLFEGTDYTREPLPDTEFEECTFRSCTIADNYLDGYKFRNCTFEHCDLSNTTFSEALIQDVRFSNCKLIGIAFNAVNAFGFSCDFADCQLDMALFSEMKLNKVSFFRSRLRGTDFYGAQMTGCTLDECDLSEALFEMTNLEKVDLSSCTNYVIDPENNRIRGARFSYPAVLGLLRKYNIKIEHA